MQAGISPFPCIHHVLDPSTNSSWLRTPSPSAHAATHQHHPIPPTVADAKAAFLEGFKRPLPGIYSTVIQELLVQQHLFRWNVTYSYNAITALGLVSIFDQLLEGLPEQDPIFEAFIKALQEDPAQYRGDAQRLEEAAKSLGGPDNLKPDAGACRLGSVGLLVIMCAMRCLLRAGESGVDMLSPAGVVRWLCVAPAWSQRVVGHPAAPPSGHATRAEALPR